MSREQETLAEKIENGNYFVEARKWYDVLYLSPMPARIYFIVLTSIAVVSMLFSFVAVLGLLPLSPRIPFVYYADDITDEIPNLKRLKQAAEPTNPVLINYFLSTYVTMHESYNEDMYMKARRYVGQYSESSVFNDYNRQTHPDNPRSPIRLYGRQMQVKVNVKSVRYDRSKQPYQATVQYETIRLATNSQQKTDWTAQINFFYTDLEEKEEMNAMGENEFQLTEPTFKVVSYQTREQISRVGGQ